MNINILQQNAQTLLELTQRYDQLESLKEQSKSPQEKTRIDLNIERIKQQIASVTANIRMMIRTEHV